MPPMGDTGLIKTSKAGGSLRGFWGRGEDGVELRSRFWMGYAIVEGKPIKLLPEGGMVPHEVPLALLKHNVKEFTNLAAILPGLYEEEKDRW